MLYVDLLRKYGNAPYSLAVVHGGPGAPGEAAPLARDLSDTYGVLEPLQTRATLNGQIEELSAVIRANANIPVTLIGHSWGAMLGFMVTAHNPDLVSKLILIGSGVFEEKYADAIMKTRWSRLSPQDRDRFDTLWAELNDPANTDNDITFARIGKIIEEADSCDPLPHGDEVVEYQYDTFNSVWPEVRQMRAGGKLLALGRQIRCPVVAIHGDYDPHPRDGIEIPLSTVLADFRFIPLERCGHYPWYEKGAKDKFYEVLLREISQ